MGWTHFVVDGRMDLITSRAPAMNINQYLSIQDGMSPKLSLGLSAFDWPQLGRRAHNPRPHLQGLDLRKGWRGLSRINHFCAGPTVSPRMTILSRRFAIPRTSLNKLGIKLGEGMTAG